MLANIFEWVVEVNFECIAENVQVVHIYDPEILN